MEMEELAQGEALLEGNAAYDLGSDPLPAWVDAYPAWVDAYEI